MSREDDLEQLSALIDGTLDERGREHLFERLDAAPTLRGRWGRYHLIGDALRGEPAAGAALGIAARVSARLAAEPVVIAPTRVRRRQRPATWLRPAIGLAVAASFGAAVVVLLPRPGAPPPGQPGIAAMTTAPVARPVEPPAQWTVVAQTPVTRWHARLPDGEGDLHRYLTDHSEFAASGLKGAMPLATLVGYDARR